MSAFTEWLQQRMHLECDTVIDCYDQARVASAEAHREAEQALRAERSRSAALEAELVRQRERVERAEAALARGRQGVRAC